ncbi:MAG: hypothetical protein AAFP89_08385 [Bacteroidota bacterium]
MYFTDRAHLYKVLAEIRQIESSWKEENPPSEDAYIIPNEALDAFESNLSFFSLRKSLEQAEEAFLKRGRTPFSSNPNFTHPISDEYWRAILNPYSEFGIGDTTFKFLDDYSVLIMNSVSPTDLDLIRANVIKPGDEIGLETPNSPNARIFLNQGGRVNNIPIVMGGVASGPTILNNDCNQVTTLPRLNVRARDISNSLEVDISSNADTLLPSGLYFSSYRITYKRVNVQGAQEQIITQNTTSPPNLFRWEAPGPGTYDVCIRVEVDGFPSGPICFMKACDRVAVDGCCDARARADNEDGTIYGPDQDQRLFAEVKLVNNIFVHRIKHRSVNYSLRNNGNWRRARASSLFVGLVNGNCKIYIPDQNGLRCGTELIADVTAASELVFDRSRISDIYNPNTNNAGFRGCLGELLK